MCVLLLKMCYNKFIVSEKVFLQLIISDNLLDKKVKMNLRIDKFFNSPVKKQRIKLCKSKLYVRRGITQQD